MGGGCCLHFVGFNTMRALHLNGDMDDPVNIRIEEKTADSLHELKGRGDSYDDVIQWLIEKYER